ncbi:Saposin-like_type B domin-containing protein [Hexamita inflata]|uniref:Saposin-like type B domin-containing protein n=1 Tax=Hexamita inflata TaxID=28002 RepID=A0AA86URS5_9EUKA|nr:Saposin-like type B domin-containing protein [Hexamita inflata]
MITLLYTLMTEQQQVQKLEANEIVCEICIGVITNVYIALEDPTNEQAIERYLDAFCQILPFDIFGWCESFINSFFEQLIYNIIAGNMPDDVCNSLGACE